MFPVYLSKKYLGYNIQFYCLMSTGTYNEPVKNLQKPYIVYTWKNESHVVAFTSLFSAGEIFQWNKGT